MPRHASSPAAGTTSHKERGHGTEGGGKGPILLSPHTPPPPLQQQQEQPASPNRRPEGCSARQPPSPARPSHTGAVCLSVPHPWDAMASLGGVKPHGTGAWAPAEAAADVGWPTKPAPDTPSPVGHWVCFPKCFLTKALHIYNPAEQELNRHKPIMAHHGLDLPGAGRLLHGKAKGRSSRGGLEGALEHGTSCTALCRCPRCCSRLGKHCNGAGESKVSKVS